jgi:hypothetical protein
MVDLCRQMTWTVCPTLRERTLMKRAAQWAKEKSLYDIDFLWELFDESRIEHYAKKQIGRRFLRQQQNNNFQHRHESIRNLKRSH